MTTDEYAQARRSAEAHARVTGSVSSTYVVDRRDPDTGELVELVRATWSQDGSDPYSRGFAAGEREANYREAYDGAGPDDGDTWFGIGRPDGGGTGSVPPLSDRDAWEYERGFGDGWAQHFDDGETVE